MYPLVWLPNMLPEQEVAADKLSKTQEQVRKVKEELHAASTECASVTSALNVLQAKHEVRTNLPLKTNISAVPY